MSSRIRLIHWNEVEAAACAATLVAAGYGVDARKMEQASLKELRADPPAAFVIDLSRMPSHGREVASVLRSSAATRRIPLVFVEGEPDKVARIRALLPDAHYTTWARIRSTLKRALRTPVTDPVRIDSVMAGYSGTPLPKKLGITRGHVVALIGAPKAFEATLGAVPEGVVLRRSSRGARDITLWFLRNRRTLVQGIGAMVPHGQGGGLWLLWPKQTSGTASDLTQAEVRRVAMDAGLVDFKICAVDHTWSGLRFSQKRPAPRARRSGE
jgi:hypothetical protein